MNLLWTQPGDPNPSFRPLHTRQTQETEINPQKERYDQTELNKINTDQAWLNYRP